ncbi:MAG: hypothetical protein Q4G45_05850 [Actinomycetia bacterium]|nr:hypothetical protein [Actinomycetes bacterium]
MARVWYSSDVAVALLTLAGLPVASTIVGITTWTALRSAWRGVLMRVPGWRAASAALLSGWCFLMVALGAAWVVATSGTRLFLSEPDRSALAGPVYAALVIPWVAAALAALSYLLAQSTSVATAIAVGTGGLLAGLVIAGNDVIAQGALTWMTAPWGWAYIASTYPGRWLLVVGLGALMTLAGTVLAALLARRAARVVD